VSVARDCVLAIARANHTHVAAAAIATVAFRTCAMRKTDDWRARSFGPRGIARLALASAGAIAAVAVDTEAARALVVRTALMRARRLLHALSRAAIPVGRAVAILGAGDGARAVRTKEWVAIHPSRAHGAITSSVADLAFHDVTIALTRSA
jgi:hypothetical protein